MPPTSAKRAERLHYPLVTHTMSVPSDRSDPEPQPVDPSVVVAEELTRLREEVMNTRNLTIKTDNLIKSLGSEIKTIARRHGGQERKLLFNSAVAYVLFVAVIAGGLWLAFRARLDQARAEQALFDRRATEWKEDITRLNAELGRWKQVERELLEFERLIKEGKNEQAVEAFRELRRVRFAGLLEHLIAEIKKDVARREHERGVELFHEGNFARADEAFVKSLDYEATPPYLPVLLHYQGMSAVRLKDFPRAAEKLQAALDAGLERKLGGEAQYHLAFAYDRMGEKRTARDLYQRFLRRNESHSLSRRAQRRWEQLSSP